MHACRQSTEVCEATSGKTALSKTQTHLLVPHVFVVWKTVQQHNSCSSFIALITHGKVEAVSLKAFDIIRHDCKPIIKCRHVRQLRSRRGFWRPELCDTTLHMASCVASLCTIVPPLPPFPRCPSRSPSPPLCYFSLPSLSQCCVISLAETAHTPMTILEG